MRGATFSFALPIVLPLAFQSTHPRGVRRKAGIEVKHEIYFNPRTSEGCDCSRARAFPSCRHFNPRTPCGVRPGIGSGLTELVEFQSTHPMRGATCPCAIFARPCRDFNPRTREGCDTKPSEEEFQTQNFNPRTREGCDCGRSYRSATTHYFNPRTREGCDTKPSEEEFQTQNFNPRTREGCDRTEHRRHPRVDISIHAPARGATKSAI